ncbi:hypothetical protein ES703_28287 [subsurface metagenome]
MSYLPSYNVEEMNRMFGGDGVVRMKSKRRIKKPEVKTVPWSDLDYSQIPELKGKYDQWYDRPYLMRHIIQSEFPEIIERLKENPPTKKIIPFE